MRSGITEFGFQFGAATVERWYGGADGRVWIGIKTEKGELQVYVTKTGKIIATGQRGTRAVVDRKGAEK